MRTVSPEPEVACLGAGEMRTVSPAEGPAGEDGGMIRTVSRFTLGASLIFEGNVMRTVSFFGIGAIGGVVPAGFSSAIIIGVLLFISSLTFHVNPECSLGMALLQLGGARQEELLDFQPALPMTNAFVKEPTFACGGFPASATVRR